MPILLLIRHATNDFVKTGRLPGRTPNIHLNDEGRTQAEALAQMLRKRPLDAVYSSPLERAVETAWRVAAPHGLPIQIRADLADIDNGDFTGKEIKQLSEDEATKGLWRVVVETPSQAKFPNGEAMLDMQRRVVDTLEAIIAAHPDVEQGPGAGGQGAGIGDRGMGVGGGESKGERRDMDDSEKRRSEQPLDRADHPEAPKKRPQIVAVVAHADVIKAALAHYLGMPFDNFQRLAIAPASVSTLMIGADEKTSKRHILVMNVNQTAG
ncbi:MAG: histidine phosphatase family protein [Candidatus Brachytrichaceae bacterium NZ_4S206]|jgi:probable phosphoglycerate mutase